jgi:hypothetical protein
LRLFSKTQIHEQNIYKSGLIILIMYYCYYTSDVVPSVAVGVPLSTIPEDKELELNDGNRGTKFLHLWLLPGLFLTQRELFREDSAFSLHWLLFILGSFTASTTVYRSAVYDGTTIEFYLPELTWAIACASRQLGSSEASVLQLLVLSILLQAAVIAVRHLSKMCYRMMQRSRSPSTEYNFPCSAPSSFVDALLV